MTDKILQNEQIFNRSFNTTKNALKIVPAVEWNSMNSSKPNATTEVYEFFFNEELVETVTVTYEDSTKEFITGIVRS